MEKKTKFEKGKILASAEFGLSQQIDRYVFSYIYFNQNYKIHEQYEIRFIKLLI